MYQIKKYIFLLTAVLLIINSCASNTNEYGKTNSYKKLYSSLEEEHKAFRNLRNLETKLEKRSVPKAKPSLEPVLPKYNPLDETPIYLSVKDQPLENILFIIAKNAGLNLVIEPGVATDKLVTVTFANIPSSVVLDKILKAFDLAWEVKDNCLYVKRYVEKEFYLNFLNTKDNVDIAAGGDIFGQSTSISEGGEGGGGGGTTGTEEFKGKFALSSTFGKGLEKGSLYETVLSSVKSILSKNPYPEETATIDPLTGVLYVKCVPSKMKIVESFLSELKKKMSKQVIIDAQILEVLLSDSFSSGIDWSYVGRFLVNDLGLDVSFGWFPKKGFGTYSYTDNLEGQKSSLLIIKDPDNTFTEGGKQLRATISILQKFGGVKVISNPHIRVKHAQPALIVSGKTIKYISQISREYTEEAGFISYTIETSSAFEGVMLGVIPFVIDGSTVDLKVFPISSRVDLSNVQEIGDQAIKITLPKVDIRNIATTIRVHNNDTIILGGLIYKDESKLRSKAPGLADVPILGWLFRSKTKESLLKEMVVIMHVRII